MNAVFIAETIIVSTIVIKMFDSSSVKMMSIFSSLLLLLVALPLLSLPFNFSLMEPVYSKGFDKNQIHFFLMYSILIRSDFPITNVLQNSQNLFTAHLW